MWASVFAALFVASLVAGSALAGGTFPSPFDHDSVIQAYFDGHRDAVRVGAVLQFGAAVPLAIFVAAVHARLDQLGIRVAGATIALTGGLLAREQSCRSPSPHVPLTSPRHSERPRAGGSGMAGGRGGRGPRAGCAGGSHRPDPQRDHLRRHATAWTRVAGAGACPLERREGQGGRNAADKEKMNRRGQ